MITEKNFLPDYTKAPENGWLFAETDCGVILERYTLENGMPVFPGQKRLASATITRLHCFDGRKEYRFLRPNGRGDIIEGVFTADEETAMDPDLIYEDRMVLSKEYMPKDGKIWAITVINRYRWTEYNTLTLNNYRLSDILPIN